jgi:hypothetical protein
LNLRPSRPEHDALPLRYTPNFPNTKLLYLLKTQFFLLYIVSIEKKLVNKIFQFYKNSQIKEKFMEKERGFKRGSEKMTVVDTLQAAYSKQDIPQEEREYAKKFFEGKINLYQNYQRRN